MRSESYEREIDRLQAALTNETFRYHLALKDGAVNSIMKEVLERIHHLEEELNQFRVKSEISRGSVKESSVHF